MMKLEKTSQRCTPNTDCSQRLRPYQRPVITVRRIAAIVNQKTVGDNPDNVTGGKTRLVPGGLGTTSG